MSLVSGMKIFPLLNIWFVIATANFLLLLPACTEAQSVSFILESDIVLVGQKVNFTCSIQDFNPPAVEQVEIYFQSELLINYRNDNLIIYKNKTTGYYIVEPLRSESNTAVGIAFTINEIEETDVGQYQCIMFISNERYYSQFVNINFVTEPECLGTNTSEASWDATNLFYYVKTGATVWLVCRDPSYTSGSQVILEWSRSDGGAVMHSGNQGIASVSIMITKSDDDVIFTCTLKSPAVENLTQKCDIKIALTERLMDPNSAGTLPTTSLTPANLTPTEQSQTKTSNNERINGFDVIVAAGSVGGVLCLALIIIVCICVIGGVKQKGKDTRQDDNDHLVRSGGSLEITTLSNDGNDNRPSITNSYPLNQSSSAEPTYGNSEHTRFVYPSIHHKGEQPDSHQTENNLSNFLVENEVNNVQTNKPNVENDYEDQSQTFEDSRILFPSSKTATSALPVYAAVDKRKQSISSVVSDADESLPSYATVDKNRDRQSQTTNLAALPEISAREDEGGLHYADVDLTNISPARDTMQRRVSSVVSDDTESLPSYATVDKNSDRPSQSVGLAGYASPENPINADRGGLHYADVDLTHSSSARKPGARSSESLYASVP